MAADGRQRRAEPHYSGSSRIECGWSLWLAYSLANQHLQPSVLAIRQLVMFHASVAGLVQMCILGRLKELVEVQLAPMRQIRQGWLQSLNMKQPPVVAGVVARQEGDSSGPCISSCSPAVLLVTCFAFSLPLCCVSRVFSGHSVLGLQGVVCQGVCTKVHVRVRRLPVAIGFPHLQQRLRPSRAVCWPVQTLRTLRHRSQCSTAADSRAAWASAAPMCMTAS